MGKFSPIDKMMNLIKPLSKQASLIVQSEQPFNAGPPPTLLQQNFITPRELFFVRSHGSIPEVDPDQYLLRVTGLVKKTLRLTLRDLWQFPRTSLTATLQCAGYRRKELAAVEPIVGEMIWDLEPMGTAIWSGVALREVLLAAGIEPGTRHVAFTGLDQVQVKHQETNFGGSIPLDKALHPEVLLAYEMNDDPLLPLHGFPLRVIAPGYIGARSVKWLSQIEVRQIPSANYFQTRAYKLFPPEARAHTVDWEQGVMLGEVPINSVISYPQEGETIVAGPTLVQGYALTGNGDAIEWVEVSIDGGHTWVAAELQGSPNPWTWRFWRVELDFKPGFHQVTVRAWDSAGNTQPVEVWQVWNFKGYLNNAWHRVNIKVTSKD